MIFCRILVTTISATMTTAKMHRRMSETWVQRNRSMAVSKAMPIPPAPTRPMTADSRTLMSHRNRVMPQKAGETCGQ